MFDAIIQLASINASKQMETLEDVSTNVANYNTTGYKAKRFDQYLNSDMELSGVTRVDTSSGDRMITKREMDVAISGPGYIPVSQPDGKIAYTRDGSFAFNSKGYMVTNRGDIVGEGIKIPIDYKTIQIKEDGSVSVLTPKNNLFQTVGKINLVRFANPEQLKNIGANKLEATPESGPAMADHDSLVKQGFLERANVNIFGQIEQVLRLNGGMIANFRMIKFTDDLYQKGVNLKQ